MVIGVGDLRKGITIEVEGEPYQVVDFNQQKMQQRAPVIKLRLKGLRNGRTVERTFSGYDVKLSLAPVEQRPAQYIYQDGDLYYFMDTNTYEQDPLTREQLGDAVKYLKEQIELEVIYFRGEPIAVELPTFVELRVTETPPGIKGNTAQGATKPATLETGHTVNLPFFLNIGDVVRVDTRTGQYLERAR